MKGKNRDKTNMNISLRKTHKRMNLSSPSLDTQMASYLTEPAKGKVANAPKAQIRLNSTPTIFTE